MCQAVDVTQRTCGSPMVEREGDETQGGCREARELPATVCSTETGQRTHSNNTRDCVAAQQDRFVRVTRNELKPHNGSRTKDGEIDLPEGGIGDKRTRSNCWVFLSEFRSTRRQPGKRAQMGLRKTAVRRRIRVCVLDGLSVTQDTQRARPEFEPRNEGSGKSNRVSNCDESATRNGSQRHQTNNKKDGVGLSSGWRKRRRC